MGDYTRFSYKPAKRYAAVLMQQGRVQLDADWNEQSDIYKHRLECQAIDTLVQRLSRDAFAPRHPGDGFPKADIKQIHFGFPP